MPLFEAPVTETRTIDSLYRVLADTPTEASEKCLSGETESETPNPSTTEVIDRYCIGTPVLVVEKPSGIPKIEIVCSTCGSDSVERDAMAEWDVEAQDWVLSGVMDQGYCEACEGEATLKEVPCA